MTSMAAFLTSIIKIPQIGYFEDPPELITPNTSASYGNVNKMSHARATKAVLETEYRCNILTFHLKKEKDFHF